MVFSVNVWGLHGSNGFETIDRCTEERNSFWDAEREFELSTFSVDLNIYTILLGKIPWEPTVPSFLGVVTHILRT